ncbi:MAG: DNA polymerase I [Bacteroidota bacterium]
MPIPAPKLFLLDAMALIYRAHFALRKYPRLNTKGMNTGAILGFTNTLVEVIQKEKPTHIAVAFDKAANTWRHQRYPSYKAHRLAQPEEISAAIPYIKSILEAFRIPALESEGYEADDILGTLACRAAEAGCTVYLMTPDKDFAQLVSTSVYLYKPAFMGQGVAILGEQEVLAQWGITRVEQVQDILGLRGDPVDNIPGIPSVGPKTAQRLIQQFGSLENVLAHAGQLTGKLREQVTQYAQQAILSKELATIHKDVPLAFDWVQNPYCGPDRDQLSALFQELEFRSLARRVLGEVHPASATALDSKPTTPQSTTRQPPVALTPDPRPVETTPPLATIYTTAHQYHLIDTPELRQDLICYLQLQDTLCLDTETTGLDPHQAALIGIAWSYYPGEAYYVPVPADDAQARAIVQAFKGVLENPQICKVGHNLKYDSCVLYRYGIELAPPFFDTMLAHYLVAPDKPHNLSAVAEEYLHYQPLPIEALIGRKGATQSSMRDVPAATIKEYAAEDADITLQLKGKLEDAIRQAHLQRLFYEIELPLVRVLTAMECQGVQIDTRLLQEIAAGWEKELHTLVQAIHTQAGRSFNIDSPKQLGTLLFDELKLISNPKKTQTGQYATSELVLTSLAKKHTLVAKILDYRALKKLKSTYVDALPSLLSPWDGRVHTSYNQMVVVTGRLSSSYPNLQNIPIRTARGRHIRKAFVPSSPDHVLMSADYAQVELRIMAAFAQDPTMLEAFRLGEDVHAATASKLFKVPIASVDESMRRRAKTANFGIIYGISPFGLAQRLAISHAEASQIIQAYFTEFAAIKTYIDNTIEQARTDGYVATLLGRRKYLRDIHAKNATVRGFAERNAINAPIQGTAAEIIKMAMIQIYDWLQQQNMQAQMIMQVHDELVFDVPKAEVAVLQAEIPRLMSSTWLPGVSMVASVGVGSDWLAAH